MKNYLQNIIEKISTLNKSVTEYKQIAKNAYIPSHAFINWGVNLAVKGNIEEAINKFETSSNMGYKSPESYINWGIALAKKRKYDDAIEKFEKAIKIDKNNSKAYSFWGAVLVEMGEVEEAEKKYNFAEKLNNNDPDIYINWGIAYARQQKRRKAKEKFEKALDINPCLVHPQFLLGMIEAELENYDNAIEFFKRVVSIQPSHADALHYMSICFFKTKQFKEALENGKKVIDINPAKIEAYINLSEIFIAMEEFEKAGECCALAEKINPEKHFIYACWGVILQKNGKPEESIEKFEKALSLKDDDFNSKYNLGLSYLRLKQFEKASLIFNEIIEQDPKHASSFARLGFIFKETEEYEKALIFYEKAVALSRNYCHLNYEIGAIYQTQGNTDKAIVHFKRTIDNNNKHVDAYLGLVSCFLVLKNIKEAVRTMRVAYKFDKESAHLNLMYGIVLEKDKQYREALEKFDKAIEIDPNMIGTYLTKAETLRKLKKYDEVINLLNETIAKFPESVPALYFLAIVYKERADFEAENENSLQNSEDYNNSLKYFEKVLIIAPEHVDSVAYKAYINGKLGNYEIFEQEFKNLLSNYPDYYDVIYEHLEESLRMLKYHKNINEFTDENILN